MPITIENFLCDLEIWQIMQNYSSKADYTHMVYDRARDKVHWFTDEADAIEFRQELAQERLDNIPANLTTSK